MLKEILTVEVCLGLIACLLAALVFVLVRGKIHEKRLVARLTNMLEDAASGNFQEGPLEDTPLSELESALQRFLDDSQVSAQATKEQKQRIQSLISDISHQTVTPIANIKIYAELLEEQRLALQKNGLPGGALPEDMSEEIEAIIDQVEKLDFLVESLVKLSRLEEGTLKLRLQKTCIQEVLTAMEKQFSKKAEQKGISLIIEDSEAKAEFDLKWTIEAAANIVDNAIKYTPEGGTVTVRAIPYVLFLRLDVEDTGIGIAEQELAAVFTRFYRSRSASKLPGVGIGLYLAREVLKRQNGYIKVSSQLDKGSLFSIFLYRG